MFNEQWLTVQDVARLLGVRIEAVRRMIRRGELPVLELGGSRTVYRISRSDLDRYVIERSPAAHVGQGRSTPEASDSIETGNASSNASSTPHDGTPDRNNPGLTEPLPPWSRVGAIEDSREFVDQVPVVVFREDNQDPDAPVFLSREIEQVLGMTPDELTSAPNGWMTFVHPDDLEAVERELARTDETGTPFNMQYRMFRRDGEVVWLRVEAELVSSGVGGQSVWEGTIIDITEIKAAESVLRERHRQQHAIADLGLLALEGRPLSDLLDQAVILVAQTLEIEVARIFEVSPGAGHLALRSGVERSGGESSEERGSSAVTDDQADALSVYALSAREPVVSDNLREETRFDGQTVAESYGVSSAACVTIPGEPRPFGVLAVFSVREHAFKTEDIYFLQSVAHVLAMTASRADTNWLTVTDVATLLQVTEETVRRWIRQMELPALNLGGHRAGYRVYPSDLDRFIRDRVIRLQ